MSKEIPQELVSKYIYHYTKPLISESYRAAVIIGGVTVEDLLENYIIKLFPESTTSFYKKYSNSIRHFNQKINFLYLSRHIPINIYESLIALKEIRNDAAHKTNFDIEVFTSSVCDTATNDTLDCDGESCFLDGEYWSHNDDEDLCNNISIEINGLDDCEGCELTGYSVVLNTNAAVPNVGVINIGYWSKSGLSYSWVNQYVPSNPNPATYASYASPDHITKIGSGEVITFEYWTSYVEDIEFCVRYTYDCDGVDYSKECCGIVDFACI